VRWAPEDALPTIARPPPRSQMVPVFLQRGVLQDAPPCSGPVSLADGGLEKPLDADLQGGLGVVRLTHARAPDGGGLTCCACALRLPRCSIGGRYCREGREGRNPVSRPPSATRRRCRAHGPPRRSYTWFACSLPCHHGKGYRFMRVPEKIRKTIPVLTPRTLCAKEPRRYISVQTSATQVLSMGGVARRCAS
jgi:hypothetical protein